ncbi:MAG: response regulator transcription factor [Firmicutes bacterium]|nr:response regulator transcription factor [Bacillota bacterium]
MRAPVRVLIVDDHEVVRVGVRTLVDRHPDLTVVGEAASGSEAVDAARHLQPDVVVMDISLPGISGIEATRQICRALPATAVLGLTIHDDPHLLFRLLDAGASGYVLKQAAAEDLVLAIRQVAAGRVFLSPRTAAVVAHDVVDEAARSAAGRALLDGLTARERDVLVLLAEGLTTREIARRLRISPKTVQSHREHIMTKLNLHRRAALVRYAVRRGLIPP